MAENKEQVNQAETRLLSAEEMEKAFNWNASTANAFSSIPTEAAAPWGVVFKEIAKTVPSMMKIASDEAMKVFSKQAKDSEPAEARGD